MKIYKHLNAPWFAMKTGLLQCGVAAVVMINNTAVLAVTSYNPVSCYQHFFYHDDGDDRFLRYADNELPNRTASHPRKHQSGIWTTIWMYFICPVYLNTGLFKIIAGVQLSSDNSAPNAGNIHRLIIPFEGGMNSFKKQGACVSRNWRYESEPPLKPSPLTCETNSIIVLMFVESQRVHI